MEASHSWSSALVLKTRVLKGTVSSNLTASASWEKANSQRLPLSPPRGGGARAFKEVFLGEEKDILIIKESGTTHF